MDQEARRVAGLHVALSVSFTLRVVVGSDRDRQVRGRAERACRVPGPGRLAQKWQRIQRPLLH
jgi:hypothetical protein